MAKDLPFYVPFIVIAPALAAVIQNFFGRHLPRKGDWLVIGAMGLALVLSAVTTISWIGEDPGVYYQGAVTWFDMGADATNPAKDLTFEFAFVVDGLTAAMLCVVTLVAFLVFLFSSGYMKGDPYYHRFYFWLSFFGVSMLLLVLADNLLVLFIGWELVGLCSYKLIGFWSKEIPNAEAAKKAFITTRIGDVGMLLGILVLYAVCGTLSISGIFTAVDEGAFADQTGLLTLAGIGLFFGAVGKSAQFPLHVWLPDAMAGPTPVSALIHAATMVAAGVYLSARMFPIFTENALHFIAWTGGITAILAAVIAVTQTDIKKVLAYSTVSQLGYMILGVGVGAPWAAMFHLCTHAMFKACLFLGSGSVIHAMHHAQELRDMGGLRKKMPVTFWTFVISTLALAGLPFTSGFLSKDAILAQAEHEQQYFLFWIGAGAAFLTAFYMTRLVWLCFFGEPRNKEKFDHAHESPWNMTVPLVILAAFSIGILWGGFEEKFFRTPSYVVQEEAEAAGTLRRFENNRYVERAYVAPGDHPAHEKHPAWFLPTMIALALGGIGLGVLLFRSGKRGPETPVLAEPVHTLAKNKYYLDEFYLDGFIEAWNKVSDACAATDARGVDGAVNAVGRGTVVVSDISGDTDQLVVDGAVNLTANVTENVVGATASAAQTGKIRNYLTAAVGVTAVAVVLLLVL